MRIYYWIAIIINVVATFVFYQYINITVVSLIPIILLAIMIFQANYFKREKAERGTRTTYGSSLTENEESEMMKCAGKGIFLVLPWMIPFILFFPSIIKGLSLLLYFAGLIIGALMYRFKKR